MSDTGSGRNLKSQIATSSFARIDAVIRELRGFRVLLDVDLAALYGVSTGRLNEQVTRNLGRFPEDFMFSLTHEEFHDLKSQIAISKPHSRGGRRSTARAFTEQGVAMLSTVLHSPRAIAVNVEIMRAFVRLRRQAGEHANLARRLDELEAKYDENFRSVFDAIRQLMTPPVPRRPPIGFRPVGRPRPQGRRSEPVKGHT